MKAKAVFEKLAVNRLALKYYKPLLEKARDLGVPVERTFKKGRFEFNTKFVVNPKTSVLEELRIPHITISKRPRHLPRPKNAVQGKDRVLANSATLAHELGHAEGTLESVGKPLGSTVTSRMYREMRNIPWDSPRVDNLLSTRAEEIQASKKAMNMLKEITDSPEDLEVISKHLTNYYKSYSPNSPRITKTFNPK